MVYLYILSTIPLSILNGMFLWIALILFSACYTFIIYLIFSSAFGRAKTHKQYDVILILGAGIFTETVTPMLASRLDRALKIYKVQSHNCNILVSGGQGPDETNFRGFSNEELSHEMWRVIFFNIDGITIKQYI
ncbi:YdcF family protein [Staphylococcus hominis]